MKMKTNNLNVLLKKVVEHNEAILSKVDYDQSQAKGLITFYDAESEVEVWDPFSDSSMRYEVEPVNEYGEKHLLKMIDSYKVTINK